MVYAREIKQRANIYVRLAPAERVECSSIYINFSAVVKVLSHL